MAKDTNLLLLSAGHILPALKVENKKQALQELAKLAEAQTGLNAHAVFEVLFAREKLATTGVGHGIAIPHGRMDNIERVFGFFARLDAPIEYEAIDGKPVDLLFMLLAPQDAGSDHLKALAKISRMFRDAAFADRLRKTGDVKMLYSLFCSSEKDAEAA